MSKLHGYHCNNCGAWLLQGETHTCDPAKLDIIDRITDFLSRHSHEREADELEELMGNSKTTNETKEEK